MPTSKMDFCADFAHQKIVMKLVHLASEKTCHELGCLVNNIGYFNAESCSNLYSSQRRTGAAILDGREVLAA